MDHKQIASEITKRVTSLLSTHSRKSEELARKWHHSDDTLVYRLIIETSADVFEDYIQRELAGLREAISIQLGDVYRITRENLFSAFQTLESRIDNVKMSL